MENRNRPTWSVAAGYGFVCAFVVCLCGFASANSGDVTIISPQNASTISGAVPIMVSASSNAVLLKVLIDGRHFASVLPNTNVVWDTETLRDGWHKITVRAFAPRPATLSAQMLPTSDNSASSSKLQLVGAVSTRVVVSNHHKKTTPTPTSAAPTPTPTSVAPQPTPTTPATPAPTPGPTLAPTVAPTITRTATVTPTVAPTVIPTATAAPTLAPTSTPTPAPTAAVSITAPLTGTTVSGTVPITAQVSAAVAWTNFYVDGGYVASSPPLTYDWNSTTVANGSHVLSATGFSSSSTNVGTSAVNVNVSNAVSATATATVTAVPTAVPTSTTFVHYVDNSGSPACSDSGAGSSPSTPWCTVSEVVSALPSFTPGEQVLFKCGDTWNEQMSIPTGVHGTASSPITIGHYGNNCVLPNQTYSATLPIINGGGVLTYGIFADHVSVSYLVIDGFEVTETTRAGIGFLSPSCSGMPGIVIKNNLVHHFNAGAYSGATEGPDSNGNCTSTPSGGPGPCDPGTYDHDMGVGFNDDCASGGQDGVQILYNTVYDSGGHNTMRVHYDASPNVLVDHNLVGPGCFHNCIDTKAISGTVSNNITTCPVSTARGYQCGNGNAGFYTENTQSWVSTPKWQYNIAHDIGLGIQAQSPSSHPQLYNNTLYNIYGNAGLYLSTCSDGDVEKNLLSGPISHSGVTTWDYNDDFGTSGAASGANDLDVDPQFVAPTATPPDFHTNNTTVDTQGATDPVTASTFLGAMGPP